MQWDSTAHAGFTTGEPWFYVNENYKEINVAAEEANPDSLLQFYRKAIALRKSLDVVRNGSYKEYFRHDSQLYVYERKNKKQKLLVVCSFSNRCKKLNVPAGFDISTAKLVLQSQKEVSEKTLQPYESRVYLWE